MTFSNTGLGVAFAADIMPAEDLAIEVIWNVKQTPQAAFNTYWSEGGYWIADTDTNMSFMVGDVNSDITGQLKLGNMTVSANDTMLARDLTIGVWGNVEFSPGFFIKTDNTSISELNTTAFAAVERVHLNYMNGTMISYFDNYTIDDIEYECIIFEYQQDSTLAGSPQSTELVYNLSTGILLYANTSYWFGEPFTPYHFEFEFVEIRYSGTMPSPWIGFTIAMSIVVVLSIVMVIRQRRE